jgi:hypothetical protein
MYLGGSKELTLHSLLTSHPDNRANADTSKRDNSMLFIHHEAKTRNGNQLITGKQNTHVRSISNFNDSIKFLPAKEAMIV